MQRVYLVRKEFGRMFLQSHIQPVAGLRQQHHTVDGRKQNLIPGLVIKALSQRMLEVAF